MRVRKVFIVRSALRIAPFGDPVADAFVLHDTLRSWQERAAAGIGAQAVHHETRRSIAPGDYPCVVLRDDVFLTADTLAEFVRVSAAHGGSTRFATDAATTFFRACAPFQEGDDGARVTFPVEYLAGPEQDVAPVRVDLGEQHFPVTLPPHMRAGLEIELPALLRPILQLRHPLHLLWANVMAVNVRFARLAASRTRQLLLAARSLSRNPGRLLPHMNRIGRGCVIHPTAHLEGAELGDGVKVGAHALVRMSSVGDGCDIGDGAVVRHCVLGKGTVLFDDLNLNFAVTYPEVFLIHGPYNLSVFGRSSAMFATILTDYRLDGKPIRLEVDGALRDYPFPFVGSFVGHRTRVAGGSMIAPGRLIPNDLLIFPSPRAVLTQVDPDLPAWVPLAIEDGRLRVIVKGDTAISAVG